MPTSRWLWRFVLTLACFGIVIVLAACRGGIACQEECSREGRCGTSFHLTGDASYRCYTRSEVDCKRSRACTEEGRCRFDPALTRTCVRDLPAVPDCAEGPECREYGRCGVFEGMCAAPDVHACHKSLACILHGKCAFSAHSCVSRSSSDCADSLECRAFGRCEVRKILLDIRTGCLAPGENDPPYYADLKCMRHPECETHGRCLRAPDDTCKTPEEVGLHDSRLPRATPATSIPVTATPVNRGDMSAPVDLGPVPETGTDELSLHDMAISEREVFLTWRKTVDVHEREEFLEAGLTRYSIARSRPRTLSEITSRPNGLLVSDGRLFWGEPDAIRSVPLAGGRPKLLTSAGGRVLGRSGDEIIVAGLTELFGVAPSGKRRTIKTGLPGYHGIAMTPTHVYVAPAGGEWPRRILRVSLANGKEESIATRPPEGFVYSTLSTNGEEVIATMVYAGHRADAPGLLYSVLREKELLRMAPTPVVLAVGRAAAYFFTDESPIAPTRIGRVRLGASPPEWIVPRSDRPFAATLGHGHLAWAMSSEVQAVRVGD